MRAAIEFPERALLYNQIAGNFYRMERTETREIWSSGNGAGLTTESKVSDAALFKGPLVNFADGKPATPEDRLSLVVDGEPVFKDAPASDFSRPDILPSRLCGISLCLFLALPDEMGAEGARGSLKAQLPADVVQGQALGLFLPNGSVVRVNVRTDRRVEIGLPMANYRALL